MRARPQGMPRQSLRPLSTAMYASVQVGEIALETWLVLVPRDTVDACRHSSLQLIERPVEQVEGDVVQQCREPNSLSRLAVSRMGPARGIRFPSSVSGACCPGPHCPWPAPSLHRFRNRDRGLVRRLHRYYGRVRLPLAVHHRITGASFPMRTIRAELSRMASQWISRFPCRWLPRVREVSDHAGSDGARHDAPSRVAFRFSPQRRHPGPSTFRGSPLCPRLPLSTLRRSPRGGRRMTRGRVTG